MKSHVKLEKGAIALLVFEASYSVWNIYYYMQLKIAAVTVPKNLLALSIKVLGPVIKDHNRTCKNTSLDKLESQLLLYRYLK